MDVRWSCTSWYAFSSLPNKSKNHTSTFVYFLLFVKMESLRKTGPAKTRAAGPLLPALNPGTSGHLLLAIQALNMGSHVFVHGNTRLSGCWIVMVDRKFKNKIFAKNLKIFKNWSPQNFQLYSNWTGLPHIVCFMHCVHINVATFMSCLNMETIIKNPLTVRRGVCYVWLCISAYLCQLATAYICRCIL